MECNYSDSNQIARTSVTHLFTNSNLDSLPDNGYNEFKFLSELQEFYDDLRIDIKVEFESIDHKEDGDQCLRVIEIYEGKSKKIPLTDDVFEQAYDYEEVLYANTVAVTNGAELFVETWNESSECYMPLQELPNYIDLVNVNNHKYIISLQS
ncbi:type I restriction enzyme HsdR N-terminal domain-containing protein [Cytobacillus sp. FJAT-53684]|uniref:Type I restriction enzyme HsdR N-terminal domain-containing protein n=1 Tax=Cytobacillus mangrovibacter TaxID=3299024 RepID=A0ABW6K600_9BACI